VQGKKIRISASFGVTGSGSVTPDEEILSETIIGTADKYLYQAKKRGRNRVIGGPLLHPV